MVVAEGQGWEQRGREGEWGGGEEREGGEGEWGPYFRD